MIKSLCAAALLLTLVGCSDPKEASEKNFKTAAQAYLDQEYPKCHIKLAFPATAMYYDKDVRNPLRALAKAGVMTEKEISRQPAKKLWGDDGSKFLINSTFELTEEGRKFYKEDTDKSWSGKTGALCFGKAQVKEIVRYTEPAVDIMGHRMAQVNYTYTVSELPSWALSEDIAIAVPALKAEADSEKEPIKKVDAFMLTNNGWIHEKLFRE